MNIYLRIGIVVSTAVAAFLVVKFIDSPYVLFGAVVLFIEMILMLLVRARSSMKKDFPSSFKIRSKTRKASHWNLHLAIFLSANVLASFKLADIALISFTLFIWAGPISDFIILLMYKRKKPFTIFVNDNTLILNDIWKHERDLSQLKEIKFDRLAKSFLLYFQDQRKLDIRVSNYNKKDMDALLDVMIEKSKNEVSAPQNYLDE